MNEWMKEWKKEWCMHQGRERRRIARRHTMASSSWSSPSRWWLAQRSRAAWMGRASLERSRCCPAPRPSCRELGPSRDASSCAPRGDQIHTTRTTIGMPTTGLVRTYKIGHHRDQDAEFKKKQKSKYKHNNNNNNNMNKKNKKNDRFKTNENTNNHNKVNTITNNTRSKKTNK